MATLQVTVVGQDIFKIAVEKFEEAELNIANQVNNGKLGNLKTLTYKFELEDLDAIRKRSMLMKLMSEDNMRLMPMFVNGDWTRIFVFRPIKT